jgi:hypothetical protein
MTLSRQIIDEGDKFFFINTAQVIHLMKIGGKP